MKHILLYRPDLHAVVHCDIDRELQAIPAAIQELLELLQGFRNLLEVERTAIAQMIADGKPVITGSSLLPGTKQRIVLRLLRLADEDIIQVEPEISSDQWGSHSQVRCGRHLIVVPKGLEMVVKHTDNTAEFEAAYERSSIERGPASRYGEQRFQVNGVNTTGELDGSTVWIQLYLPIRGATFFVNEVTPPWESDRSSGNEGEV